MRNRCGQAELTAVQGVEAPDPRTVVVRTRFPFAALPNRLAGVPIWVKPLREGDHPVGTGPYRVKRWTPRGDTVLEAFAGHRGGAPAVKLIEFRVVPSVEERLALLRRGIVHLVVDVPSEALPAMRASGLQVLSEKGLRVLYLGMDSAREANPDIEGMRNPLRDVRVRRAVGHAIDRQGLVRGPLGGTRRVSPSKSWLRASSVFTRPFPRGALIPMRPAGSWPPQASRTALP